MNIRFAPSFVICAVLAGGGAAQAARLSIVYSFAAGGGAGLRGSLNAAAQDGRNPYAGLARDTAGNFYGTTYAGGAYGGGTVFMLSPGRTGWAETVIHSFSAPGEIDGAHPLGGVLPGAGGVLYGTTSAGGGRDNTGGGTVFALHPPAQPGGVWTEAVLAAFPAGHGAPAAGLLQDEAGAIYGTTSQGGSGGGQPGTPSFGTVFRLKPPPPGATGWTLTDLYSFPSDAGGQTPLSGLIAGPDGALYGTTEYSGGKTDGGTVFRLAPPRSDQGSWVETNLFDFGASDNGSSACGSLPTGGLVIDEAGRLYGTASAGGARGAGTVFRLTPPRASDVDWTCAALYHFTARRGDGFPQGGVAFGRTGTLIGTTASADRHQQGAVFQLIPGTDAAQTWSETVLARFPVRPPGGGLFPVGELVGDGTGGYLGVTETGGKGSAGTVFEIVP